MWLQNELRATAEEIAKIEVDNEDKIETLSETCSGNSSATLIGKDENLLTNGSLSDNENAMASTEYQNGSAEDLVKAPAENLLSGHKNHLDVIVEAEEDTSTASEELSSTKVQLQEVLKEIAKLKEENSRVRTFLKPFLF